MKLSKEQIDQLFEFTRKKYVSFYDVQVEIVDHLAEAIEAHIKQHPNHSFDQALQTIYTQFGIFGFAKVVQEKQKAVEEYNNKLWRNAFLNYFTIPKISITLLIFTILFTVSNALPVNYSSWLIIGCWVFFLLYEIWFIRSEKKFKPKMPLLIYRDASSIGAPGFIFYQILFFFNDKVQNPWLVAIAGVLIFVMQSAVIQVYKIVRNKAISLYPEAFSFAG